ncbi:MAG: hypothetical protein WB586_13885 [Chthoniobacterales bacterium]
MKVRWTHDNLRLRITPSELQSILDGKPVTERFQLSGEPGWKIAIVPAGSATELLWVEGVLRVRLSSEDRLRLASSDAEGVYFERAGDPALRYFVEKDFPCVHPRAADAMEKASDTFNPPPGFEARKATESEA